MPSPVALRPRRPAGATLGEVAARVGAVLPDGAAGTALLGATHDSRSVRPGDLYAGLPGAHRHGADFAAAAAAAGAAAVLTDPTGEVTARAAGLPVLVLDDPRAALGPAAAAVYGDPGRRLRLIGVTGTNGKTTTAYLAESGLRAAGCRTGLIGTVETRIGDDSVPSERTTPEATDLQALFAVMVERGVQAAVMEVSSHALALHRVDGTRFDVAVFTNLSQDHLDFHADLEDYFAAKARLFTPALAGRAVVNADDPAGARLLTGVSTVPTAGFSPSGRPADWSLADLRVGPSGSDGRVRGPAGELALHVPLPGAVNAANALAALAALDALGVPPAEAVDGIAGCPGVPGRMERVDAGQPFLALVDYAHTPEAVTTLLAGLRPLVPGRLVAVLGCGGDRDRGKRPLMGAALARGADLAVLTSDNPRSEDPAAILAEMAAGAAAVPAAERGRVVLEPDRAAAIAAAVAAAGAGDAVVVAGKGHERGQQFADHTEPFDDREVLARAVRARTGRPAPGEGSR